MTELRLKNKLLATIMCVLPVVPQAEIAVRDANTIKHQGNYNVGNNPRIDPVPISEIDEESMKVLREMRKAIHSSPPQKPTESFAIMANHPKLMRVQFQLSSHLHNGELSPRDRELAILRIAWLCQAPYEWGEHVVIAKRVAGMTDEEVEWVTVGHNAPGWRDHERAILLAVDELHSVATISDGTWAVLQENLTKKQLYELPVLVGTYQTFAYMHKSLKFPLRNGNKGLEMR